MALLAVIMTAAGLLLGPRRWVQFPAAVVLLMIVAVAAAPLKAFTSTPPAAATAGAAVHLWEDFRELDQEETADEPFREQVLKYARKFGLRRDHPGDLFNADGAYQYVRVYEDNDGEGAVRVLCLDYLIHGYVDVNDPGRLRYGYEKVYRDVALCCARGKRTVSAFFIGGGSYTFPRWVLHQWPDAKVDVAEIDPLVQEANRLALGLKKDTPVRTFIGDARNVVDDLPAEARYDFFFGDAFNDLSVPWHLTTVEFARKVKSRLRPDGAYLLNVIDNFADGLFLAACRRTLARVFPYVYVFCTEKAGVSLRRDTFVVVASRKPLKADDRRPGHSGDFAGSVLTAENIRCLDRKRKGLILTDDFAPVENLLAPVVQRRK